MIVELLEVASYFTNEETQDTISKWESIVKIACALKDIVSIIANNVMKIWSKFNELKEVNGDQLSEIVTVG